MATRGTCGTIPPQLPQHTRRSTIPRKPHLRTEHYVRAGQFPGGPAELARRTHDHLVDTCPQCAAEWQRLGRWQDAYLDELDRIRLPDGLAEVPLDHLSGEQDVVDAEEEDARRRRRDRRRICEEKWELLRTPPQERIAKVTRARSRFRSLFLAEMLIDECRQLVLTDPAEARSIVELVPHVLAWTADDFSVPYAPVLLARASAHRANALRIAGDLHGAERAFIALRRTLAHEPLEDPRAVAEVASLEASLCIGQRRFEDAAEYLAQATRAAHHAGDPGLRARIYIQRANLMQVQGRTEAISPLLDHAASLLDPTEDPHLFLCTVTGRVNSLCDLGRPEEARHLLTTHLDDYEASENPYTGAIYRFLEGRCALALDDTSAVDSFAASRDAHLALGRSYDAALASLYLAEALFVFGRTRDLQELAASLVTIFRSHRVGGETLAALRLLARAVASQAVNRQLFSRLREKLDSVSVSSF